MAHQTWVTEELVRKRLNGFSQEELDTTRLVFLVESTDELVTSLVKFINYQAPETITYSLMVDAIEVRTKALKKHLEKYPSNARNN